MNKIRDEFAEFAEMGFTAERIDDVMCVRDAEGGVWWPSDEAEEEISAQDNPALKALIICVEQPMRGTWKQ